MKERYEFLLDQKNDLTEAKDTLYQVINEMDEEMVKRFGETFAVDTGRIWRGIQGIVWRRPGRVEADRSDQIFFRPGWISWPNRLVKNFRTSD